MAGHDHDIARLVTQAQGDSFSTNHMPYLSLTKALADESRLRLLALLSQRTSHWPSVRFLFNNQARASRGTLKFWSRQDWLNALKKAKEAYFRLTHRAEIRALVNPLIEAIVAKDANGDLEKLRQQIQAGSPEAKALETRFYAKWDQARAFFVDEQQAETRLIDMAKSMASPYPAGYWHWHRPLAERAGPACQRRRGH